MRNDVGVRIRGAALVGGIVLALVGALLAFVLPNEPLVRNISLPGPAVDRSLWITTERAIGFGLLWLASLTGSRAFGGRYRAWFRHPLTALTLGVSVVVAMVGFYLVFVADAAPTFTIGSFSFDSDGISGRRMPFFLFLTTERAIGMGLLWLASLVIVGTVGQSRRNSRK